MPAVAGEPTSTVRGLARVGYPAQDTNAAAGWLSTCDTGPGGVARRGVYPQEFWQGCHFSRICCAMDAMEYRPTVLDRGFEVELTVRLPDRVHTAVKNVSAAEIAAFLGGAPESGAALAFDLAVDTVVGQVRGW